MPKTGKASTKMLHKLNRMHAATAGSEAVVQSALAAHQGIVRQYNEYMTTVLEACGLDIDKKWSIDFTTGIIKEASEQS